jgi:hypothetical protein
MFRRSQIARALALMISLAAAGAGSFLATSDRFNEPGPAPQEAQIDMAPSDPAVAEPERKFTREPSPAAAEQTA